MKWQVNSVNDFDLQVYVHSAHYIAVNLFWGKLRIQKFYNIKKIYRTLKCFVRDYHRDNKTEKSQNIEINHNWQDLLQWIFKSDLTFRWGLEYFERGPLLPVNLLSSASDPETHNKPWLVSSSLGHRVLCTFQWMLTNQINQNYSFRNVKLNK